MTPTAPQEPTDPLIGYAAAPEFPAKTLSDLRAVVATYVAPKEPLFDFSNEPGIFSFLIAWELMSLSSFLLVGLDHKEADNRSAALIYLGATRVGTAFLAAGFLWAHALTASWAFRDWHIEGMRALGPGLLILVGLGVKAGMWPFHLWLPALYVLGWRWRRDRQAGLSPRRAWGRAR